MWFLIIPALLAGVSPPLALVLFLVFFAWREIGGGLIAPGLEDMIARVIPVRTRGSYWGLTSGIGAFVGIGASALGAWLLTRFAFPTGFVAIFVLAAVAATIGWLFLTQTREAAEPPRSQRQSQLEYFAGLPEFLRQDRVFLRFLEAQGLLSLAGMGLAFVTIAAVRRWGVPDGTVGLYTAVLLLGQGTGNLAFGVLADRRGHKVSLEFSAAFFTAAYALALVAPNPSWYYLVFFLLGVGNGAQIASRIMISMEFGTPDRRPTYLGISNTTAGLVSMLGPLLAAWLAGMSFELLFAVCVVVSLLALAAMCWWAQDPRHSGDGAMV
jgi:MFS family permease